MTEAVASALTQLGESADPVRVTVAVKVATGMEIGPGDVIEISEALRKRARTPPGPDQPPPENARRTTENHAAGFPSLPGVVGATPPETASALSKGAYHVGSEHHFASD